MKNRHGVRLNHACLCPSDRGALIVIVDVIERCDGVPAKPSFLAGVDDCKGREGARKKVGWAAAE